MGIVCDILFFFYVLAVFPFLLLQGKVHSGLCERLGFLPRQLRDRLSSRQNIWVHAVSVGEAIAVEGLVKRLRQSFPDHQVVLSVSTKTGHALALQKYAGQAVVIWSPLDFSLSARVFVRRVRPLVYIAAETELWPNLFRQLTVSKVPILVVNGRISDRSYPVYWMMRWALKSIFCQVRHFAMQTEIDARRVVALGAPADRVSCVGNVKFDNVSDGGFVPLETAGTGCRFLVAGSTHPGEEKVLLDIYAHLRGKNRDLRLVIAPRHPQRAGVVADLVSAAGLQPVLFSARGSMVVSDSEVLIVDVIGRLLSFYAAATLVFVGKSLTVKGGHNIIEPAALGKPVFIGPFMDNFRDITRLFVNAGAVVQVNSAQELEKAMVAVLGSAGRQKSLGARALEVVSAGKGATDRTFHIIDKVMEDRSL